MQPLHAGCYDEASPSPRGEGRDEGKRFLHLFLPKCIEQHSAFIWALTDDIDDQEEFIGKQTEESFDHSGGSQVHSGAIDSRAGFVEDRAGFIGARAVCIDDQAGAIFDQEEFIGERAGESFDHSGDVFDHSGAIGSRADSASKNARCPAFRLPRLQMRPYVRKTKFETCAAWVPLSFLRYSPERAA